MSGRGRRRSPCCSLSDGCDFPVELVDRDGYCFTLDQNLLGGVVPFRHDVQVGGERGGWGQ